METAWPRWGEVGGRADHAVALDVQSVGTEHEEYATSLNFKGNILRAARRYVEAEDVHRHALGVMRAVVARRRTDGNLEYLAEILNDSAIDVLSFGDSPSEMERALAMLDEAAGLVAPDAHGWSQIMWNRAGEAQTIRQAADADYRYIGIDTTDLDVARTVQRIKDAIPDGLCRLAATRERSVAVMRYVAAGVMQGAGVVRRANLLALLATAAGLERHVLPLVLCAWIPRESALSIELGDGPSSGRGRRVLAGVDRVAARRAGAVRAGRWLAGGPSARSAFAARASAAP